jgi:LPS O-antigen subunit length determinant protein (WzzB/FepE family)
MKNNDQFSMNLEDKIDIKELFDVLWAGKFKIILITTIFALGSVFHSLSIPNQYKASAILAPSSGGVSDSFSQLGGLASLAGIQMGGSSAGNETKIASEIMQSWSFIESFVMQNDLAPILFAADSWDEKTNQINYNKEVYDYKNKTWLGDNGTPTSWEMFEAFSGVLSIEEDKRSGLTKVSIEYISPDIAKLWVDLYVSSINEYMQVRKIQMVNKNIEYLDAQIDGNTVSEMREVFFGIISEQIKSKMMAEATPDYAFITVSPSMVPEKKSQPSRAMICIIGTLIGGIFSIFLVLILHYGIRNDQEAL